MDCQQSEVYYLVKIKGSYGYMSSAKYASIPRWAASQTVLLGACQHENHAREIMHYLPPAGNQKAADIHVQGCPSRPAWNVVDVESHPPPPTAAPAPAWGPWKTHEFTNYSFGASVAAAGASYTRRRPVRNASLEADVFVPGIQAAITSLVASLSGWGGFALLKTPLPFALGLGAGAMALAISWLILLRDHRALLWETEKVEPASDKNASTEDAKPNFTTVEITDQPQNQIRYIDVPLDDDELRSLARGLLVQRHHFSRRSLVQAGVVAKEKYTDVLDIFLSSGLGRSKGRTTNAGVELTGAGRAFLKQYL